MICSKNMHYKGTEFSISIKHLQWVTKNTSSCFLNLCFSRISPKLVELQKSFLQLFATLSEELSDDFFFKFAAFWWIRFTSAIVTTISKSEFFSWHCLALHRGLKLLKQVNAFIQYCNDIWCKSNSSKCGKHI